MSNNMKAEHSTEEEFNTDPNKYGTVDNITNYHDNDNYSGFNANRREGTNKKCNRQRPKVLYNWKHKDILKLIAIVEKQRHLWDKDIPKYKQPKGPTWEKISAVMVHVTPDECKAKWTNLRVSFNINLSKYRRSLRDGKGPDSHKFIAWKYFIPMFFLENMAEIQEPIESLTFVDPSDLTDEAEWPNDESPPTDDPPQLQKRRPTKLSPRPSTSIPSSSSSPTPDSSDFANLTGQLFPLPLRDDFSAFGEFVVSELRSIPPDRAAYVKRKLNRTLMDLMDEVETMPDKKLQQSDWKPEEPYT